jgi:hypothetical protein
MVRNCTVADNPGAGILASAGRIERNRVLRNATGGISAGGAVPCEPWVIVRENLIEDNGDFGLTAGDLGCGYHDEPAVLIEHNRIRRTRSPVGEASGMWLLCCPQVINNEIVETEGAGILLHDAMWWPPPSYAPGAPVAAATIVGQSGPGVRLLGRTGSVTLSHVVLWGNGGGDVENLPGVTDILYTLSEAPLPGTANLDGVDPLLVSGPGGDTYLSQISAGQADDSPTVDAGSVPAEFAGLQYRTTRTDGVRDQGTLDLGFHYEPWTFTLFRHTDPVNLPPHLPDVVLPVSDPGAAGPGAPSILFYEADSDEGILLRRSGNDVEVRFRYQEFD